MHVNCVDYVRWLLIMSMKWFLTIEKILTISMHCMMDATCEIALLLAQN
jgi:hypothetical protein